MRFVVMMSNIANAFSEGTDTFIAFVKALPPTVQETVAAGLIVAFVVGALALFRNTQDLRLTFIYVGKIRDKL